jgi:two-component system sensor kinase FixL
LQQSKPQHQLLRLLHGSRTLVLLRAGIFTTVIALIDWRFDVNISFGFLYLFPMLMVGGCLARWQIALVAALYTGLSETFGSFPWTPAVGIPRLILTFAAFFGTGLFVFESARNRRLANQHLAEIEKEVGLRREAEEQLKFLIESSPATIFTLDAHGKVLLANDAAHRLLGMEPHKLEGQYISRYFPALAVVPPITAETQAFRTVMECRGWRLNGEVLLAHIWFSTYRTVSGPRLAAVVFDASDCSSCTQHPKFLWAPFVMKSGTCAAPLPPSTPSSRGASGYPAAKIFALSALWWKAWAGWQDSSCSKRDSRRQSRSTFTRFLRICVL